MSVPPIQPATPGACPTQSPIEVVLNPNSKSGAANELRAQVQVLFERAGRQIRFTNPRETAVDRVVDPDPEAPPRMVVAAGGDGTVSAVAGALAGTRHVLGVLPLGTLNHFAKDLGIPLTLEEAVDTVVQGQVVDVDVAEVNGRVFVNNSSLGLYPRIVASREAQQERLGRGKWTAFVWAVLQVLHRYPNLGLRIAMETEAVVRRTPFLFVGNNEYKLSGFELGARDSLQGGCLGLYVTHSIGRLGLVRLGLHALFGRIEQAEDFDAFCVQEAWVESRRPELLVAMDGEVTRMTPPLHYRTRPRALRVQVPRTASAG